MMSAQFKLITSILQLGYVPGILSIEIKGSILQHIIMKLSIIDENIPISWNYPYHGIAALACTIIHVFQKIAATNLLRNFTSLNKQKKNIQVHNSPKT